MLLVIVLACYLYYGTNLNFKDKDCFTNFAPFSSVDSVTHAIFLKLYIFWIICLLLNLISIALAIICWSATKKVKSSFAIIIPFLLPILFASVINYNVQFYHKELKVFCSKPELVKEKAKRDLLLILGIIGIMGLIGKSL